MSNIANKLLKRCNLFIVKYNDISHEVAKFQDSYDKKTVALRKTLSQLEENKNIIEEFLNLKTQLEDAEELQTLDDPEIVEMAKLEIDNLNQKIKTLEPKVKKAILPKVRDDESNIILEIRAGVGGDEASLFAAELFSAYVKFAELKNWKVELLDHTMNDIGTKEVSAVISGKNVYSILKYESGVHRVQRIPTTEVKGRIHTSTISVAVLPEPEEIDIKIPEKDIRIDVFRAGGHGGQSVNTTDSAVRITHLPTKLVVCQQDEKSQHKNKAKAMKILRARLYEKQMLESQENIASERRDQIGAGDRAEKIRTCHFAQNRVTDHRINYSIFGVESYMAGEKLEEFSEALKMNEVERYLSGEVED